MARKQQFAADDVVEALHNFATHIPSLGTSVVIHEGQRLRGNSEAVLQNPQFFVPAGLPHDEVLEQRNALYVRELPPVPEAVATKIAAPLRDEDAVVPCGLVLGVPEGKRMAKDDPAVRQQPDAFVPVVGKGLTRDHAFVALTTMKHTDAEGRTRTVWQGQWVAKDDALVTLHPHSFGPLPSQEQLPA